jgi:N-acetylglutamate synthase-like GNAT family acetyltransferase
MNNVYEVTNNDFIITTDIEKIDIQTVHAFLSNESYWAKDISFETVKKSIENSLTFAILHQHKTVGFARLVTDKATFAYLADVFVITGYRRKGLGKWLIKTIHNHPELQGLRRWILATKDAHDLYSQFGWSKITEEQYRRFMQMHQADMYKNQQ